MIKVNLISKKRRGTKGRDWTRLIINSLFGAFALYFLGITLYVLISTLSLKNSIAKVNEESEAISSVMLKNNEKLSRFVLTKLILGQIENANKDRFRYKDYLDEVSRILPSGVSITGVDFSVKGWMSITVTSNDIFLLKSLERVLLDSNTWTNNRFFSSAYIEGVTKDKTGAFYTRLQFELKQINGTN